MYRIFFLVSGAIILIIDFSTWVFVIAELDIFEAWDWYHHHGHVRCFPRVCSRYNRSEGLAQSGAVCAWSSLTSIMLRPWLLAQAHIPRRTTRLRRLYHSTGTNRCGSNNATDWSILFLVVLRNDGPHPVIARKIVYMILYIGFRCTLVCTFARFLHECLCVSIGHFSTERSDHKVAAQLCA